MIAVEAQGDHLLSRLFDFFGTGTPWHRRLWDVGTVVALHELLEASEARQEGVLGEEALKYMVQTLREALRHDLGIAPAEMAALQGCLSGVVACQGLPYRRVRQVSDTVPNGYLLRWSRALQEQDGRFRPERAARYIAGFLLDLGFSPEHLHRWLLYKVRHEPGAKTLGQIISDAQELAEQKDRKFTVMVAFRRAPPADGAVSVQWNSPAQVSSWLQTNGFDPRDIRQSGGVLLDSHALDAYAAVGKAAELVQRLLARAAIGARIPMEPLGHAWVTGERRPIALFPKRRVEVLAIEREKKVYAIDALSRVDRALEILSPLESAAPAPAIAGGWAAIEALLTAPGDERKSDLAIRLATLVAFSFPRAELTGLAWTHQQTGNDELAEEIGRCRTNLDKAKHLAQAILDGRRPVTAKPSDAAAFVRVEKLLVDPKPVLEDVRDHVTRAFRRLYRHRNLVLHGGRTEAVALSACLRTVAPLVGAGIDRIAHAWFVHGLDPLELAARAENRLCALTPGLGVRVLDLLE